jgi:hypothetical protein
MRVGQHAAAHDRSQGQHDFNLVVVYALQHLECDITQGKAERDPANGLLQEKDRHVGGGDLVSSGCQGKEDHEDDNSYPVIEESLADDFSFQAFRRSGSFNNAEDGDRVRGRNQGAEQQAGEKAYMDSQKVKEEPRQSAHYEGRGDNRCRGEQEDVPFLPGQVLQVDLQRPGEQHETEHAVQERLVEVDTAYQASRLVPADADPHAVQHDESQGDEQGYDHHADGGRQAEDAVVDESEQRCKHYEYRGYFEQTHGNSGKRIEI